MITIASWLWPARRSRTAASNSRPPPRGRSSPKIFNRPRIWLARSSSVRTSWRRALNSVRTNIVPFDLTRTWRKKPVRRSCAKPSASFASVLLILQERAALA